MTKSAQTSAMRRINALLDENSFVEVGAYITARNTDFNMQAQKLRPTAWLPATVPLREPLCMCTARMQPLWAAPWVRCMQKRSRISMAWP